jgi:hypothetical protein
MPENEKNGWDLPDNLALLLVLAMLMATCGVCCWQNEETSRTRIREQQETERALKEVE